MSEAHPLVAVLMGSASDLPVLDACLKTLDSYAIPYECRVLSAHRTPHETAAYVEGAEQRGIEVIIAAAGMAAHLAGVAAAHTALPVIGIPVASGPLNGQDALLSTVMMPPGMPVATVAINGSANAAHLAAQILSLSRPELRAAIRRFREAKREEILAKDRSAADR
jgi:5-(carboxyamino)imidazole ribonucleotide mutase